MSLVTFPIKNNTIKAEDLAFYNRFSCPKGSPIPDAIKAIKANVETNRVWLEQPTMLAIAKTNYEINYTAATAEYSSSAQWVVTLAGSPILVKRDGKVGIAIEHITQDSRNVNLTEAPSVLRQQGHVRALERIEDQDEKREALASMELTAYAADAAKVCVIL